MTGKVNYAVTAVLSSLIALLVLCLLPNASATPLLYTGPAAAVVGTTFGLLGTLIFSILILLASPIGLYFSSKLLLKRDEGFALAFVLAVVGLLLFLFLTWLGILGWIIALLIYFILIKAFYRCGWLQAIGIWFIGAVIAWVVAWALGLLIIGFYSAMIVSVVISGWLYALIAFVFVLIGVLFVVGLVFAIRKSKKKQKSRRKKSKRSRPVEY